MKKRLSTICIIFSIFLICNNLLAEKWRSGFLKLHRPGMEKTFSLGRGKDIQQTKGDLSLFRINKSAMILFTNFLRDTRAFGFFIGLNPYTHLGIKREILTQGVCVYHKGTSVSDPKLKWYESNDRHKTGLYISSNDKTGEPVTDLKKFENCEFCIKDRYDRKWIIKIKNATVKGLSILYRKIK